MLLRTIRYAQRELIEGKPDPSTDGYPQQSEYFGAFAAAWHGNYRAPKKESREALVENTY